MGRERGDRQRRVERSQGKGEGAEGGEREQKKRSAAKSNALTAESTLSHGKNDKDLEKWEVTRSGEGW